MIWLQTCSVLFHSCVPALHPLRFRAPYIQFDAIQPVCAMAEYSAVPASEEKDQQPQFDAETNLYRSAQGTVARKIAEALALVVLILASLLIWSRLEQSLKGKNALIERDPLTHFQEVRQNANDSYWLAHPFIKGVEIDQFSPSAQPASRRLFLSSRLTEKCLCHGS